MDDAELTRLAIAEIVREMGEIKEPAIQERKINPIAKPNKRFLGRTLNSVLSHNKRKNDRTQENCRKKLRELDERREIIKRMRSRSRSGSWELVLSSSSDEDHSKDVKKSRKHERKTKYNKLKKSKRRKSRCKKDKRRYSSSSSSSRDSSSDSDSSSSTSRSSYRRKKSKLRKSSKAKTRKIAQPDDNAMEVGTGEIYYEPDINAAIEFDAALMANNYRQHQLQQILYYNTLMAGHETSEIEALKEELRISDAEVSETQKEKASISSAASSLNLNESDSDGSEVLQISLSSATSSGSEAKSNASIRKKKVKRKLPKADLPNDSSDGSSSDAVILELDSDSSHGDKILEIIAVTEKQTENDECICITSESETTTDDDSESESSTSEKDIESTNNTNEPNSLCHAVAETVTLLSSSDSEMEIITLNGADASVQNLPDRVLTDSTSACEKQSDLVLCVPAPNANAILGECLTLNSTDESAQKLPDVVKTAGQPTDITFSCEKQSDLGLCVSETNAISISEESLTLNVADESAHKLPDSDMTSDLVICASETNAILMPNESLTTVADDSVVRVPEKNTNLSVEVNSLITPTECSSPSIKVVATEMPICEVQEL
uniref:Uncharacterized protein n=1 Tax=Zeugodacus cucurbitae TaxID=28588 RepID=A0A0A1X373_ZEUCU